MARNKHQHIVEHDNHERWLISFADYMTLLFALFVVLYALAASEKGQSEQVIQGLIDSLQQQGLISNPNNSIIFPGGIGITGSNSTIDLTLSQKISDESLNINTNVKSFKLETSAIQIQSNPMQDAHQHIRNKLQAELDSGEIELEQLGQQLVIRIHSTIAFAQDSHFLQPQFYPIVSKITTAIVDLPGMIQVTGFTDSSLPDPQLYRSNMELSALRAVSIANVIMRNPMIRSDRIHVIGAGSAKANNRSNKSGPRIVEISIAQGSAASVDHPI